MTYKIQFHRLITPYSLHPIPYSLLLGAAKAEAAGAIASVTD